MTENSESSSSSPSLPLSQQGNKIEIRQTSYETEQVSRGVFTNIPIKRGELVERAHALVFSKEEQEKHLCHTLLEHYTYSVPNNTGEMMLALGIGSLFNHAETPNVDFRINMNDQTIEYFACRDIEANAELCIFYGERGAWWKEKKKYVEESAHEALPQNDEDLFS